MSAADQSRAANPTRAVGYVRVSTETQADHGISLAAQEAKIRAMAVVQGVELLEVIVDAGESAKSLNRPGMSKLLAMVDSSGVDVVVIAKLDRITRSVSDLAELLRRFERRNVSLVSVADSLDTGSAAGRLVLHIMVSVSQWERETIAERTKDAMRHKKTLGECVGNVAYGWRRGAGNQLETCATEQRVLEHLRALRERGYTLTAIAAELNRQGFRSRRCGLWSKQSVSWLLKHAA